MADDIIDLLKIKIEKAKSELPEATQNAIAAVDWKAAILGLRTTTGYTFEQLGDLELETELLLSGLISPENYPKELENRMKISKAAANELANQMNVLVFKKIREELIKNEERKKIFQKNERVPLNSPLPERPFAKNENLSAPSFEQAKKEEENKAATSFLKQAGIEIIERKPAQMSQTIRLSEEKPALLTQGVKETLPIPEKLELPPAEPDNANSKENNIVTPIPVMEGPIKIPPPVINDLKSEPVKPVSDGMHPILAQKLSSSFQIPTTKTEYSLDNITKTPNETKISVSQSQKAYPKNADPYRLPPE